MRGFKIKKKLSKAVLLITILLASFGVGGGFKNVLNLLPKKTKASIQKSYVNYKQDYDESIRKAQQRLDKLCEHHNYGSGCDMSSEEDISYFIGHLKDKLGFEIVNPLEDNEEVREFAEEIMGNGTLENRIRKFHKFIYENSELDLTDKYTVIEVIRQYKKDKELEKKAKLKGDCFSLSNLFIAGMRGIDEEAYYCEVIVDYDGREISKKSANENNGGRHACSVIKTDDKYLVDVSKKSGFKYPHKKIEIKNDIEVIASYLEAKATRLDEDKHYRKVRTLFQNAIAINPFDHNIYYNFGFTNLDVYPLEESLLLMKKANQLKPNDFINVHGLGLAYAYLKEYDKAKELFKQSIELYSNYAGAYNDYAIALFKTEKYKEAKQEIEKAIKLTPNRKLFQKSLKMINEKLSPSRFD